MKNILVPFDFSNTSTAALKFAVDIARRNKTSINLLYIIVDPFVPQDNLNIYADSGFRNTDMKVFLEGIKRVSLANLNDVIKNINARGVKIVPHAELYSSAYKGILAFIGRRKTGLVIMGTHGQKNLKTLILGTNTERVFRMTNKPVLIVRDNIKNLNFKRIVFATDLEPASKKVLNQAWKIIKMYDAKTDILRINSSKDSIRSTYAIGTMRTLTKNYKGNFDFLIKDAGSAIEGISKYCDKVNADLLIIGVHRKKGYKRIFTDRVSEGITRLVKQPILTIDISSNR